MNEYYAGYITIISHPDIIKGFDKTIWEDFILTRSGNLEELSDDPERWIAELFDIFFSFISADPKAEENYISRIYSPRDVGQGWRTEELHALCDFLISQGCGISGHLTDTTDGTIEYDTPYGVRVSNAISYLRVPKTQHLEAQTQAQEYAQIKTILASDPRRAYTGKQLSVLLALLPDQASK